MLGKLMKYELKYTARIFLPIYAVTLLVTIVTTALNARQVRFFFYETHPILRLVPTLMLLMYVLLLAVVFLLTYVVMTQRFYKNMLRDEGYLMFTLPATVTQHLNAKILISALWMAASMIVGFACIVIVQLAHSSLYDLMSGIAEGFRYFAAELQISTGGMIASCVVFLILMCFTALLPFYFAVSVGQMWREHRILGAIGVYVVYYIVEQIVASIGLVIVARGIGWDWYGPAAISQLWYGMMGLAVVCTVVFAVAQYLLSHYALSRKLNLE